MIVFRLRSVSNPSVDGMVIKLPACPREGDKLRFDEWRETYIVNTVKFIANCEIIELSIQFAF